MQQKSLLLLAAAACSAIASSPPNILVFLVDDAGWSGVGFHNPTLRTPAIDSLKDQGIFLSKHYVCE